MSRTSTDFRCPFCCGIILLAITSLSLIGGISMIEPYEFEISSEYRERILTIATLLIIGLIIAVIFIVLSIWIYLKESKKRERILEVLPEKEIIEPILEEQPEEIKVSQEEVEITTVEEHPEKIEALQEEIEIITLEEQPEDLIPLEPQIINCPFCGFNIPEETTFCPQCGMIFKKK
jgi:hypothetical protein